MQQTQIQHQTGDTARKARMEALARATLAELRDTLATWQTIPAVTPVRGPETGLVMVRGRIGGGGAPFNLGEATVTRATIRLSSGEIGHGQMLGTDKDRARLAAILDALAQRDEFAAPIAQLVANVTTRVQTEDQKVAEETAATRVDFFTMVRGDD